MDNKQRALQALIESPTITAAAEAAGVTRRTMYNYLNNDDFRSALKRQRETAALERAERLSAARETALQAVLGVMNDSASPPAVRVLAAKAVLTQADAADAALDGIMQAQDFKSEWF